MLLKNHLRHLVLLLTYVKLFKQLCSKNNGLYSDSYSLLLIRFVSMMHLNYKAMPTNSTDYRCHVKVHRTCLTNHMGPYHVTSCYYIVSNNLGADTYTYTNFLNKSHFKKPAYSQCTPGLV